MAPKLSLLHRTSRLPHISGGGHPSTLYHAVRTVVGTMSIFLAMRLVMDVALMRMTDADDVLPLAHVRAAAAAPSKKSTDASAALASTESFGFFDNIPDDEWRERQERARSHRHQIDPQAKKADKTVNPQRWLLNNYYPLFSCPNVQRVGTGGDGPKWVCDPLRLRLRRQQQQQQPQSSPKCLVYSVGCNGDYTFEDALVNLVGIDACEVHVFDVKPEFDRPTGNAPLNIHFHPWGLASSYNRGAGNGYHGDVMTLQDTMTKLGHVGRTLDLFKIDCEGCEWTTYKDWIGDSVDIRQLLIETHGFAPEGAGIATSDFFDDIQKAGFALFYKEPNIHPQSMPGCSEWSYVKLRKSFFGTTEGEAGR